MIKRLTTAGLLALALFCATAAQATPLLFATTLRGSAEAPPNDSPATGFARIIFDEENDTMRVIAQFSGLLGTTMAAHIHCCTAEPFEGTVGVATTTPSFPGFPLGVTSGSYDQTFDLDATSTWSAAFLAAAGNDVEVAQANLLAGLQSGRAYFNVHTTQFPAGEIRGFLVPEPSSLVLLVACVLALATTRRRLHRCHPTRA